MINTRYESFSKFYNALDLGIKEENSWENVYPENIENFIYKNIRIIVGQENLQNAENLQTKLFILSNKINEKFITFQARNLSFEIMGIANGIFSNESNDNDYFSQLPTEIRQKNLCRINCQALRYVSHL